MPATLSFHVDAYRQRARQRPHQHESLHFSLVLSGVVSEHVGSHTEYGSALSVVAKDAGVVHSNDYGTSGARFARLSLHGGTLGALLDDPSRACGWRWSHHPTVARCFMRLVLRGQQGETQFLNDDLDVVELLAAFTARPIDVNTGGKPEPPRWLAETVERLRAEWHPRTTVANVAQRAGVHPVYLARCTRRWYGVSVGDELRRLRLSAAVAALGDGDSTVSEVAHRTGYSDEAHLNRALRAATSLTPGRYRQLLDTLAFRVRGVSS